MAEPYVKQEFSDFNILYADQLNHIENEIYRMSQEPNIYTSDRMPENAVDGDIWIIGAEIDENNIPIEIPTYYEEDYGKVLTVTPNGLKWISTSQFVELPQAEEEQF